MNKSYLISALLVAFAILALYHQQTPSGPYSFDQFKADYAKVYAREGEQQYRKTIFLRNLIKINEHNSNEANTWNMGVNQFTDLTDAEFAAIYLTLKVPHVKKEVKAPKEAKLLNPILGDIDWVGEGKVTPIKNQGACGSCWAFAATAGLESAYLIEKGATRSLSEQELVDCSSSYGNMGCNGGWMDSAFDYIVDNGISSDSEYPYTARDGSCKGIKGETTLTGYTDAEGCDSMINALSTQPISVAVDASVWSPYRGGVLSNCGTAVNHGVLVVGATDDYWRVKNSWGGSWGENGFIRLARGNTCAVCSYPSYPQI